MATRVLLIVLLVLTALSGLWSAILGPVWVGADVTPDAVYTFALYVARAVPMGLAVAILAILEVAKKPVAGFAAVLIISAVIQLADSVIGFVLHIEWLGPGAAAFAVIQALTAVLLTRQRMLTN